MRALQPLALVILLAIAPASSGQENYTFQSGNPGDGFTWPALITDTDCLFSFDSPYEGQTTFCNSINNPVMFGGNYVATGNASRIDGAALWGNPRPGSFDPDLYMDFDNFFFEGKEKGELEGLVMEVSFDLAWATSAGSPASPPPIDSVFIVISDYDGNVEGVSFPLNETFNHGIGGSGVGREGRVTITPFGDLENIYDIDIFFDDLAPAGSMAEFAIDNMEIRDEVGGEGPSEVFPVDFEGQPSNDSSTNCLKGAGNFGFSQNVKNGGIGATTFSITWTGSSPLINNPNAAAGLNVPIAAGETVFGAARWVVDTDTAPSGNYSGSFLVENDNNDPMDPDDTVTLISFELHDPPILSDNTASVINPASANQISISNAANEPHPGATRASVEVEDITFTDSRFSLSGMSIGDKVDAGQTEMGTVSFNSTGVPAGTYTGSLRVGLEMTSPIRGFLNRKQPVSDRVWTVQFTVAAKNQGVANVVTGQNLGTSGLEVTTPTTGVTLLDGTSGSNQTLTASIDNSPPADGGVKFVNQAIDLGFSIAASLYVIQIGYQDADLPTGFLEEEQLIYSYNTGTSQWVEAIELNSNSGASPAGADPFIGSYADFLASVGGGTLDSGDLSAYGIDPTSNQAWVVVDRPGKFRLGVTEFGSLPPEILSITRDPTSNTNTITYQSIAGEAFGVTVSEDLESYSPLPDTTVGDDSIKTYTHSPPAGKLRQFYRFTRN